MRGIFGKQQGARPGHGALRQAHPYRIMYMKGDPMDAISYTSARASLAATMDSVCEDHDPVIITRTRAQSVVMLSLDDFEALQETAYLLRSPRNARRLQAAIDQLEAGQGVVRELPE